MKLLVLDIDGTLVNSRKELTPATYRAIEKWRAAGHLLVIATGRPTAGVQSVADKLQLADKGGYILSYNGGCITEAASGALLCEKVLPPDIPRKLVTYAKDREELGLITYREDTVLSAFPPDEYIRLEALTINQMKLRYLSEFADAIDFPVHKCLLTAPPDAAEGYMQAIALLTEGRVSVYRSERFFIEVMPLYVDKASALEGFIPQLGIARSDVICCGDGYNDISMIRWAGLGVAMANAPRSVQDSADYVTGSCDEDGVAGLIEKLLREDN